MLWVVNEPYFESTRSSEYAVVTTKKGTPHFVFNDHTEEWELEDAPIYSILRLDFEKMFGFRLEPYEAVRLSVA